MFKDIVNHIVTNIIRPQLLAEVTVATGTFCRAARDEAAAARNEAARPLN